MAEQPPRCQVTTCLSVDALPRALRCPERVWRSIHCKQAWVDLPAPGMGCGASRRIPPQLSALAPCWGPSRGASSGPSEHSRSPAPSTGMGGCGEGLPALYPPHQGSAMPNNPPPYLMAMGSLCCLSVFFFSFLKVYTNNFFKPNRDNTHASCDPFNAIPLSPVNPEIPAVTSLGESFQKYSTDIYIYISVCESILFECKCEQRTYIFPEAFFFQIFFFPDVDHF